MKKQAWFGAAIMLAAIAGAADAQDGGLPDGPARALVETTCSACHPITQITSQHRTAAQWGDTVDLMISRGAQVSDANYPAIVDYLAKNFGMGAPAADAPPKKP